MFLLPGIVSGGRYRPATVSGVPVLYRQEIAQKGDERMIGKLFCPDLLHSGPIDDRLWAIQDGLVNFYVVEAPEGLICFDIGWRQSSVKRGFESQGLDIRNVTAVFVTHMHWDHARCLRMFPGTRVFCGAHESASVFMKRWMAKHPFERIRDDQTVAVAGLSVHAVDTPGHTQGSVSYVVEGRWLFTGDTCRIQSGRVFPFPAWFNRDETALGESIQKLAQIEGVECLLTSHSGICRNVADAFKKGSRLPADLSPGRFDR